MLKVSVVSVSTFAKFLTVKSKVDFQKIFDRRKYNNVEIPGKVKRPKSFDKRIALFNVTPQIQMNGAIPGHCGVGSIGM